MSRLVLSLFLVLWMGLFSPQVVFAQFGDLWGKFETVLEEEKAKGNDYVANEILKPLAKDVGGIFGGGSFHTGKACGFPGFDIGGHLPLISKPSKENKIIYDNLGEKIYGLPWVQVEIGLPATSFDLILRGFYLGEQNGSLLGAGIKYSLLSGIIPLTPAVSFSLIANQLSHEKLNVYNFSLNSVISVGMPAFTPYLGLGIDSTTVEAKKVLQGLEATASGWRLTGGVNFKFVPSTYFHLGLGLFNSILGYELGLGISF